MKKLLQVKILKRAETTPNRIRKYSQCKNSGGHKRDKNIIPNDCQN